MFKLVSPQGGGEQGIEHGGDSDGHKMQVLNKEMRMMEMDGEVETSPRQRHMQ
jgi:hypothetical protein